MSEIMGLACGTLREMAFGPPTELILFERISFSSLPFAVSTDEVAEIRLGPVVIFSGRMSESPR